MSLKGIWPVLGTGVLLAGLAGVVGAWTDNPHGLAGVTAVFLCVPPACFTIVLTRWLAGRTKFAGLIGMAAGTGVRVVFAVGGGAGIYLAVSQFREWKYGFWAWVLGAYLTVLIVETAILSRYFLASTKGNAA